ncbi:hypothetical protein SAMN04488535_1945 [Corynebacterium mycetoides]|uniref:Uncharacterized protein n=1 Tax=Corynebacterium mycetoides TaxID=38302 RepID=A0A1G9QIL2_9CORY|nr:hypothetical protein [Corynebacterium mycetoides]SDM10806.1 hypothetical protein SAMN04488535_1945 [Corynebacterium mycetoides]
MSLTQKFGDFATGAVERAATDEYESSMVHKSNTVLVGAMGGGLFLLGAVLAWAIPGIHSALSILIIVPLLLGLGAAEGWLKHYHVRQKAQPNVAFLSTLLVLAMVQIAGIGYNVGGGMNAFAWSMLGGGVIGAAVGLFAAGTAMDSRHASDLRRREEQLDAEERLG